ncbi:MAG: hypothetical protein R3A11_07055 [Bdellovibrionota bacterium]
MGDGTTTSSPTPGAVSTIPLSVTLDSLMAGRQFSCALTNQHALYCWGSNVNGQLNGVPGTQITSATEFAAVSQLGSVSALAESGDTVCGLSTDKRVHCWGENRFGVMGIGNVFSISSPSSMLNMNLTATPSMEKISAGSSHFCVVDGNNGGHCRGSNALGQLGNSSVDSRSEDFVAVEGFPTGVGIRVLASGSSQSCAIGTDSYVYCWGSNSNGQLGDGTNTNRDTAVRVQGVFTTKKAIAISAGTSHSCGVTQDHLVFCWGRNNDGQLGDDSTTDRNLPVQVTGTLSGSPIVGVSLGGTTSCAYSSTGQTYCWGNNDTGQLGDGTYLDRDQAISVLGIPGSVQTKSLSSGLSHNCALGSDQKAYCWGGNAYGQLGDGTSTEQVMAQVVQSGDLASRSIKSVELGNYTSCALTQEGVAYCWGNNQSGAVGDGTFLNRVVPTKVAVPGGVTTSSINVESDMACAQSSRGKNYCWGNVNSRNPVFDFSTFLSPYSMVSGN